MIASAAHRNAVATGDGVADALSDVMEAFNASTADHLLRIEERLVGRLRVSAALVALWAAAFFTAAIAWLCACTALALALAAAFSAVVAGMVLAAAHGVMAVLLFRATRPQSPVHPR